MLKKYNQILNTILFTLIILSSALPLLEASDLKSNGKIKVIIDTDIAEDIDDILVTAYAINSPGFDVLAVTTVDGDVQARSRVARRTAQIFGHPEIPVAAGYVWSMPYADTPYPSGAYGVTQGELAPAEEGLPPGSSMKADELIAHFAEKYPGEVNLVTIGSMTNVGQLLVRYPESAKKLKRIVTNGGVFYYRSDQSIGWNLRYDPVAAIITSRSKVPWVLLSESTSRYASLGAEDMERLKSAGLPSTDFLLEAIELWIKNKNFGSLSQPRHTLIPHLSDLCVFAYLLGGWLETTKGSLYLEIGPRESIPGFRVEENPDGNIILGKQIPRERGTELRKLFMDRLTAPPSKNPN